MKQSRNYKRDSQSECKQALEIWPESGGSRVSAYRDAVALVLAQDAANAAWDTGQSTMGAMCAPMVIRSCTTENGEH